METWRSYEIVRHCRRRVFFCCCLYWTVNNFIVSEHIEIACFLSLCLYRAESSIGQHARTSGSVQEWVHVLLFISRTSRANPVFKLTNRSHVAVHLFSNRSQMTSKCGKNKNSGTRGIADCVTDVLTTFWRLLWSITESDTRQHAIYLFYIIITKSLFYFKIFQHNAKAGLLPRLCTKKAIWLDLWSFQNEAISLVELCVAKNCDWSRKITPLSNLTRASLLVEWKLTAKAELNCEFYKSWRKCWKNQVSFCDQSSPVSRKAWTLPWKLQELKNTLGKLVVMVNLEASWFKFWMKGA